MQEVNDGRMGILPVLCLEFRRYHVPRSWLKPTKNLIVVFEELGGNPWKISLVKRMVHTPKVRGQ